MTEILSLAWAISLWVLGMPMMAAIIDESGAVRDEPEWARPIAIALWPGIVFWMIVGDR